MSVYRSLPDVYQVEVTSNCQAKCPRCPRESMVGKPRTLDVARLQAWIERGDFDGSWYVELQLAGEPLLHPQLAEIIDILRGKGLLVGMSTNGGRLASQIEVVRELDALTISIDDVDLGIHAQHRPGVNVDELSRGLVLLSEDSGRLSYINAFSVQGAEETDGVAAERADMLKRRWPALDEATFVKDCRIEQPAAAELCINPWSSVSIQADGTVVSCCYIWGSGDDVASNVYGNLNERSLADIWNGPKVKLKREEMRAGHDTGYCARCYQRSPVLLHFDALSRALRRSAT